MTGQLNWFKGGVLLGLVFLLAVLLVKPIGVSTQFVILDGIIWSAVSDNLITENPAAKSKYSSSNPYLNKSGGKYAKNIAKPINYSFIFVLSMILGAFISVKTNGPQVNTEDKSSSEVWRTRFGTDKIKRYSMAFMGGVLVIVGARLAGGCTSGHMMSGIMQTSVSGYMFALGAFASAIPVAILMFGRK